MAKIDNDKLLELQEMSLKDKILYTETKIMDFYNHYNGNIYVSWSGGKDSTVLADIARGIDSEIPLVFSDTGLEYPEIRDYVFEKVSDKNDYEVENYNGYNFHYYDNNIIIIKPKYTFKEVIEKDGYPVISKKNAKIIDTLQNAKPENFNTRRLNLTGVKSNGKKSNHFLLPKKWWFAIDSDFDISHKCCFHLKKYPFRNFGKHSGLKPMIASMAEESRSRKATYLSHGCNYFKGDKSNPMAFWKEQDVLRYIYERDLGMADIYGEVIKENGKFKTTGANRTGCMFCMFGLERETREGKNRFQKMEKEHPKQYKYCMENLGMKEVLESLGFPYKYEQEGVDKEKRELSEEEEQEILDFHLNLK